MRISRRSQQQAVSLSWTWTLIAGLVLALLPCGLGAGRASQRGNKLQTELAVLRVQVQVLESVINRLTSAAEAEK